MRILKSFIIALILLHLGCEQFHQKNSSENIEQILEKFYNSESPSVLITAHREQHTKYPENSLAAISHSIESEVDIIEIDVRQTKDGKLVLLHDCEVDRTTNGKGKLKDYTLKQLQKLQLVIEGNELTDHTIPLLEDALELAKGKILIDLDIKDTSVKKLISIVQKTNTREQVIFFHSDFSVMDSVMIVDSSLMIMPRARSSADVDYILNKYSPYVIHIDRTFNTEEVVTKIKKNGARVWINALGASDSIANSGNWEKGYSKLIMEGANIIQTDLPSILNKYLKTKNLR